MLRKLVVCVLLLPLSLNGLWMVCAGVEAFAGANEKETSGMAEGAECSEMCVMEKAKPNGPICLITADESKSSVTIFMLGVAVIPSEFSLVRPFTPERHIPELSRFYIDPALFSTNPPPRV